MAVHAVPQDVEADDKLIGFLSLKQFIFTVIGLGFGYLTFFFFTKVHPLAALIWMPFSLVFLVLGLYQRKDQPAEVFLVSALGFYLKPKTRIWSQDGYEERVNIIAPPVIEKHYTKDFTGEEARGRLSNLSLMMDSRGWASKRVDDWQNPQMATVAAESDRIVSPTDIAQPTSPDPALFSQPADPYDDRSLVGRQFEEKIVAADDATHEQALQSMQQAFSGSNDGTQSTSAPATAQTQAQQPDATTMPVQPATTLPQNELVEFEATKVPAPVAKEAEPPSRATVEEIDVPHTRDDGSVEVRLH